MAEFGEPEPAGMAQEAEAKKAGISKKLIIVVAVLVVALIAFIFAQKSGAFLDDETKYAIQAAKAIQDELLVPDSINILDVYVVVKTQEEIDQQKQEDETDGVALAEVYIYCTAQNKGGGITDEEYLCAVKSDGTCTTWTVDKWVEEFESMYTNYGLEPDEEVCEEWGQKNWDENYESVMKEAKEVKAEIVNKNL